MEYIKTIESPMGDLLLSSDGRALTGLWFDGQKYFARSLEQGAYEKELAVFDQTKEWLDIYFSGDDPGPIPSVSMKGSTFRKEVWDILREIPYGQLITYGDIAKRIAAKRGLKRMSAQAVGGAVGHNPIGILVPCHRVVGSNGNLTGYAGGLDKKIKLLEYEGIDVSRLFMPKVGTAL